MRYVNNIERDMHRALNSAKLIDITVSHMQLMVVDVRRKERNANVSHVSYVSNDTKSANCNHKQARPQRIRLPGPGKKSKKGTVMPERTVDYPWYAHERKRRQSNRQPTSQTNQTTTVPVEGSSRQTSCRP